MSEVLLERLVSAKSGVKAGYVANLIKFYDEKATIPFVSRYRKDQTGNLDEVGVAAVYDAVAYFRELFSRKAFILEEIEKKGKLTPQLKDKIENCFDAKKLEDLYLPYKEKRKTRAEKARDAGLEPLALLLMGKEDKGLPLELALGFLNEEKGYGTPEKVLEGACYLIGQYMMEAVDLMEFFVADAMEKGLLHSSRKKGYEGADSRFEDYYEFSESLKKLKAARSTHRFLAVRRGEELGVLTVKTEVDESYHIYSLQQRFILKDHFYQEILRESAALTYSQYLRPALDTRIRQELTEIAEQEAISVFSKNLYDLFMAPPIPYRNVIGLDPGLRTGIKTAVLDKDGTFVCNTVLHINTALERDRSALELARLIKKYEIGAIGIGNGTGSREAYALADAVAGKCSSDIIVAVVDESGASVYSASPVAREEFPDLDVTVRGAISIGRRLQNPLAELVKIDPRSVGVGQYQHDVEQKKLKEALDRIVQNCVNQVGVDLNTASYAILTHISGLAEKVSKNIVEYREQNGFFTKREELKKVKGIGPKIYEQCAGFLRIRNGKNLLDNTRVHPESYGIVTAIAKDYGKKAEEIIGNREFLVSVDRKKYLTDTYKEFNFASLLEDLMHPGKDPRKSYRNIKYKEDIHSIADLKTDMVLEGRVTNVTNFGAFIDIGVHNDGLCHISQMADRYVSDPSEIVKVGDVVSVKVTAVDTAKKRISLKLLS